VLVGRCEDEISLGEKLVLTVSITLADFTVRYASEVLAYHGWVDLSVTMHQSAQLLLLLSLHRSTDSTPAWTDYDALYRMGQLKW